MSFTASVTPLIKLLNISNVVVNSRVLNRIVLHTIPVITPPLLAFNQSISVMKHKSRFRLYILIKYFLNVRNFSDSRR